MLTIKRVLDTIFAALGLIVLAPLYVVLVVLVYLFNGRPVIFHQVRPGHMGHPFVIHKFRTMSEQSDGTGDRRPDDERLTRFGRVLRSFSLDELPELVNILRGEMSFVGPRPLLMEYLPLYSAEQLRRHNMRPGLTGWAQVNGRNAADWPTRLSMDVWYVDHWSLWLDLRILVLTVWKVVKREGVNQPGHPTVEKFRGNS